MAVEVKPTGEHGKKKWCVVRNGEVVFVKDTNSEACLIAAELAKAEEEALEKGKKAGVAAVKKEISKPPTAVKPPALKLPVNHPKNTSQKKMGGKKR